MNTLTHEEIIVEYIKLFVLIWLFMVLIWGIGSPIISEADFLASRMAMLEYPEWVGNISINLNEHPFMCITLSSLVLSTLITASIITDRVH